MMKNFFVVNYVLSTKINKNGRFLLGARKNQTNSMTKMVYVAVILVVILACYGVPLKKELPNHLKKHQWNTNNEGSTEPFWPWEIWMVAPRLPRITIQIKDCVIGPLSNCGWA